MQYGLITKKDHRNMNLFLIGTILLLAAGWVYQAAAFPDKIPQQVVQFAPPTPAIANAPVLAVANVGQAAYDPATETMTIDVDVTNRSDAPINLTQFTTTTLTFTAGGAAGPGTVQVSPSPTIEPGSSPTRLTLTMQDPAWEAEHLVPIGESQLLITGVMTFEGGGEKNYTELEANLQPRF
jgi:methane/ammonia monooxygenase subunit B